MATLVSLSERIASNLNKSMDYELIEMLKSYILDERAMWLRREYERTNKFPTEAIIYKCFKIEEAEAVECCDVDKDKIKCKFFKTEVEFPQMITIKSTTPFISVFNGNNTIPYTYIAHHAIPLLITRYSSSFHRFYTFINKKIYLISPKLEERINASFVPVDKRELFNITDCKGNTCTDNIEDFEIESHLVPLLEESILKRINPQYRTNEIKVN